MSRRARRTNCEGVFEDAGERGHAPWSLEKEQLGKPRGAGVGGEKDPEK